MFNLGTSTYIQINLSDIINGMGEDCAKTILSHFSCPLNPDVENFLLKKAIEFSKRDFSKTFLVFWRSADKSERELIGYYTIAQKPFFILKEGISNAQYKKIAQYGVNHSQKGCQIPSILIGQLGKNFAVGNDTLISGDDLLSLALQKVKSIQTDIGGIYTYLECEDNIKLLDFYKRNGFIQFGKRVLDYDETDITGLYLIQLLKRIN